MTAWELQRATFARFSVLRFQGDSAFNTSNSPQQDRDLTEYNSFVRANTLLQMEWFLRHNGRGRCETEMYNVY